MKVFAACLAFIICTFASGAESPGKSYQQMNIFDIPRMDVQNSMGLTIRYFKSMFKSMERKVLQTENRMKMLEEKLQTYVGKNTLVKELENNSISAEKVLKSLDDSPNKSENVQNVQVENLTRRLESMEHKLLHVHELEAKLHKTESRLSLIDELETKLRAVEQILVKMHIETRDEMRELSAMSEDKNPKYLYSTNDNGHSDKQWNDSPIDRNVTHIKKVQAEQTKGVPFDIRKGLLLDGHVAFSASGLKNQQPLHPGERIIFGSLDYNEGGGFHASTGTFICPISGTYFFAGTISSAGYGYIATSIKIDGVVKIIQYSSYHLPGDNMSTGVTVAHCQAGQSVWMEITSGEYLGTAWQKMSGFLIWPDI
ncbi:hypothetical protein ACJMK2_022472 [Sinanodonta woodiana]|uniref:C1q domain-containing protein n=1 Tax=Sinanodonta woodiana TaxID=1069815 RepID=A0ABD3TK78_SINWO